jgi:carbamate kinase
MIEGDAIEVLLNAGVIVIAAGGGGIPVVRDGRTLRPVDAVIDKDRASAMLARRLMVDLFVVSTDVDRVYLGYRTSQARPLDRVSRDELARYHQKGHFPPGSMGPKIEAVLKFLEPGGRREAIVTSPERLWEAIRGQAGTHVTPAQARAAAIGEPS